MSAAHTTLAKLDKARQMLAESRTLTDVKKIRDIAEAARVYAKAAHLSKESQLYAAEIALLAACKAGEILKQLGRDTPQQAGAKKAPASIAAPSEYRKALDETGTAERTAQYWQKLSDIPAVTLTSYVAQAKGTNQDISQNGLLKFSMREERGKKSATDHTTRIRDHECARLYGENNSVSGRVGNLECSLAKVSETRRGGHNLSRQSATAV